MLDGIAGVPGHLPPSSTARSFVSVVTRRWCLELEPGSGSSRQGTPALLCLLLLRRPPQPRYPLLSCSHSRLSLLPPSSHPIAGPPSALPHLSFPGCGTRSVSLLFAGFLSPSFLSFASSTTSRAALLAGPLPPLRPPAHNPPRPSGTRERVRRETTVSVLPLLIFASSRTRLHVYTTIPNHPAASIAHLCARRLAGDARPSCPHAPDRSRWPV